MVFYITLSKILLEEDVLEYNLGSFSNWLNVSGHKRASQTRLIFFAPKLYIRLIKTAKESMEFNRKFDRFLSFYPFMPISTMEVRRESTLYNGEVFFLSRIVTNSRL